MMTCHAQAHRLVRPGETLLYDVVDGQVARQSRVVLMLPWL